MKCATKTVAAALWLAIVLSPTTNGQQPETPKHVRQRSRWMAHRCQLRTLDLKVALRVETLQA
ncbi:MAG: hypothetical protein AABO41_26610 [Acidobacteriota bacterium]